MSSRKVQSNAARCLATTASTVSGGRPVSLSMRLSVADEAAVVVVNGNLAQGLEQERKTRAARPVRFTTAGGVVVAPAVAGLAQVIGYKLNDDSGQGQTRNAKTSSPARVVRSIAVLCLSRDIRSQEAMQCD